MGLFKKKTDFVDMELDRLYEVLKGQTPGTDEYNCTLDEMAKLEAFAGKRKERKSFLDKSGRGNLLAKIFSFAGVVGFAGLAYKAEKDGTMLFGKLGDVITSFARTITKWI